MKRVVTDREIYDEEFAYLHKTCMEIAIQEALELSKKYKISIENFDISALSFQHYKMWMDKWGYIQDRKKLKQKEVDKEG